MLTREQILQVKDLELTEIEVPEWGGNVFIKKVSGKEGEEMKAIATGDTGNQTAKYLALVLCDEKGQRLFVTDEDISALGEKAFSVLDRLLQDVVKVCGLNDGAVEEEVKN